MVPASAKTKPGQCVNDQHIRARAGTDVALDCGQPVVDLVSGGDTEQHPAVNVEEEWCDQ